MLLERLLEAAGDGMLAPSAMTIWLIGSGVVIFGETYFISRQEWLYAPIVVFVMLAFVAHSFWGRLAPHWTFAHVDWLGNHCLEPGMVGYPADCAAAGRVLSLAPLRGAGDDWICVAWQRIGGECGGEVL